MDAGNAGAGGTHWIVEGKVDQRWPIYTRGNIGEVFPEVVTALSYELGVQPFERAWRQAYAEVGLLRPKDFASDAPVIIGLFGGYGYLNLAYLRIAGVRTPGSSAETIDASFFNEGNAPPYKPQKGDRSVVASLKMLRTVLAGLKQRSEPPAVADSFAAAAEFIARRPPLDAPDELLLAYMHSMTAPYERVFANHMYTTGLCSIVAGVLIEACVTAGRPGLVTHLIGAAGDVLSARYSRDMYALAQIAREDAAVSAAFDAGVAGLADRLVTMPEAERFNTRFAELIAEHGHRGPNDWELSGRTWDNTPELALIAIDRMRLAERDLRPEARLHDDRLRRQAAIDEVRPKLRRFDRSVFDKAVASMPYWSQAREATRDRAVRCNWPVKQVYRELVRRAAERGGNPDPVAVALLSPTTELPRYLAEPASMNDLIAERAALHKRFAAVEPRFFITSQDEVPSIEELEREQAAAQPATAAVGDVLTGNAGCAGVAQGRVRVVLDPDAATDLMPGDVLVAPLTDPAWTPLFLPASAVVVNVGSLMSHAVIVSRELAIPCVVSVAGATRQLVDGMLVEVDGTAGTVTVLQPATASS
jgi:pyruvate,water dikinase